MVGYLADAFGMVCEVLRDVLGVELCMIPRNDTVGLGFEWRQDGLAVEEDIAGTVRMSLPFTLHAVEHVGDGTLLYQALDVLSGMYDVDARSCRVERVRVTALPRVTCDALNARTYQADGTIEIVVKVRIE